MYHLSHKVGLAYTSTAIAVAILCSSLRGSADARGDACLVIGLCEAGITDVHNRVDAIVGCGGSDLSHTVIIFLVGG